MIKEITDTSSLSDAAQGISLPVYRNESDVKAVVDNPIRGRVAAGKVSLVIEVGEYDTYCASVRLFEALISQLREDFNSFLAEAGKFEKPIGCEYCLGREGQHVYTPMNRTRR
ncbi:hypothetical protein GJU93_16640 [Brucella sp. 10RB9212]|uniref:hypothetical protein n=1 Tax=unclassified Brucella TaxID=2632610 RepID=UPI000972A2FC|nr:MULTISPECIES: hypothetical protein [unclassified Brucella]APY14212.1 hypothetical protein BKD02_07950 [Brucella sp. 09RB8910]APY14760.1 hypothetical protein BKD02_11230 [Brucella sp. 09RB8910]MRN48187.1 hypothetical protein [Brucella sp. 10RB9212]